MTNNYYNYPDNNSGAIDSGGHPGDANADFTGNDGPSYDTSDNFNASDFGPSYDTGGDFSASDFGPSDFGGGGE